MTDTATCTCQDCEECRGHDEHFTRFDAIQLANACRVHPDSWISCHDEAVLREAHQREAMQSDRWQYPRLTRWKRQRGT
jgi:hypothetical protein